MSRVTISRPHTASDPGAMISQTHRFGALTIRTNKTETSKHPMPAPVDGSVPTREKQQQRNGWSGRANRRRSSTASKDTSHTQVETTWLGRRPSSEPGSQRRDSVPRSRTFQPWMHAMTKTAREKQAAETIRAINSQRTRVVGDRVSNFLHKYPLKRYGD